MMTFSSPRSLHATSIKHHDRGLTLVFGSDGQVSLMGFDGGVVSQPAALPTFAASNTGTPTLGTRSSLSDPTPVSPVPNLEATSATLTGTSSSTLASTTTSVASSLVSSSYGPSSTATDTDTNIPSIPTVNYPTPSPTAVSDPKDHGVGAPFYLAIVLASISFIGCVAALIAWWIRSRARKRDVELDDPWNHRDSISDADGPFTDNANGFEKEVHTDLETKMRPYYIPASVVPRGSSNLAVPHTIPILKQGTSQNGVPPTALVAGYRPSFRRANDTRFQNVPSSQATSLHSRPGMMHLRTGLSVQESTRTLGRLRVANRVPGDITSGDEGGMNIPRLRNSARLLPVANTGGYNAAPAGENAKENTQFDQYDRFVQEGDAPSDPPGPATLSWGRRTDTVAALQRPRWRTPDTTVRTYKNPKYGGYLYPILDGGPSGTTWEVPAASNREENNKDLANSPPDVLGWKNTLTSSFWQAVDAMTGNRSSDPGPSAENVGSGSRFTPAPQRVASRRSPVSSASTSFPGTAPFQEAETEYELTLPEKSFAAKEVPQDPTRPGSGSSLRTNGLGVSRIDGDTVGGVEIPTPKQSELTRDLSAGTHQRHHPDSLGTDAGSVYSTDSAAARANLRKYGYGNSIPSSWSALAANRESQLDLNRMYLPLPLPRPIRSSSPGLRSITPSPLRSASSLRSSSVSRHTPMQSKSDVVGSDDGTLQSDKTVNTASVSETTTGSMYSMSRNGTMESGRSTIGHRTAPSQTSSTTSSMLSRRKGVTTRRKRPRAPARAPSTASSVQSIESGLSLRDTAVRRALLERRKKVKAAGSLGGGEDSLMRSRDASSFLV